MEISDPTVIALFDVLGFESRLRSVGLRKMGDAYNQVAEIVNRSGGSCLMIVAVPERDNLSTVQMGSLVVEQDFFSDTFIFWAKYDFHRFRTFCGILSQFFCEVLRMGVPVRGGISVGEAIMDKTKGHYLGQPLAEAAHVEKAQEWVGVSFGPSFANPPFSQRFDPETVLYYTAHRKPGYSELIPGVVLDWPRYWRSRMKSSPLIDLKRLDTDHRYSAYYHRTLEFVEYSEKNADWYKK
jgi:hypothetical protein